MSPRIKEIVIEHLEYFMANDIDSLEEFANPLRTDTIYTAEFVSRCKGIAEYAEAIEELKRVEPACAPRNEHMRLHFVA